MKYRFGDSEIETGNVEKYVYGWNIRLADGEQTPISKLMEVLPYSKGCAMVSKNTKNIIYEMRRSRLRETYYMIYVFLDNENENKAKEIATDMLRKKLVEGK